MLPKAQVAVRVLVALALALALLGCSQSEKGASASTDVESTLTPEPEPVPTESRNEDDRPKQAISVAQKLVRDAEIHLEVGSYKAVRPTIEQKLARAGGYVANVQLDHSHGSASHAEMILRIPAPKLDAFIAECVALGTVLKESRQTRDITEEYYDSQARLRNARKLEARLLELLETKTEGVKDLLEVERELARVREQIETTEGRLRVLDDQVALSKVTLRLTTRDRFDAGEPQTLSEQVSRTFGRSVSALVMAGQAFLLLAVALLPWLPIFAVTGYVGYRVLRWLGRIAAVSPPPQAHPSQFHPAVQQPVQPAPVAHTQPNPEDGDF